MILELMQAHCLDLCILSHIEEDDKSESQRVDNGCHLVSFSVCDKVFEHHASHGLPLIEQTEVCERDLYPSLELQTQKGEAENDAKENEQENLGEHSHIEGKQREGQNIVEDDTIYHGKDAE